jgi:hypothetical protein
MNHGPIQASSRHVEFPQLSLYMKENLAMILKETGTCVGNMNMWREDSAGHRPPRQSRISNVLLLDAAGCTGSQR